MHDLFYKGKVRKGHKRVLRGGSWNNFGRALRSANRFAFAPDSRLDDVGLRLAGALWAGGSINQRLVLFRWLCMADGQSPGSRCVSRQQVESLPVSRLIFGRRV